MEVNDEVLVQRIVGRAEEARAAGKEDKKTSPLIGYYHCMGQLEWVPGLGAIDEVSASISAVLEA